VDDKKLPIHRETVGKSIAPKAFKPTRGPSHVDPNSQQDQYEDPQYDSEDRSRTYEAHPMPTQRGNDDILYPPKQTFRPTKSKMNQTTKFDTPSEKGFRGNAPSTIGSDHSRSSGISGQARRARGLHTNDIPKINDTPTGTGKLGRPRGVVASGMNLITEVDLGEDLEVEFNDGSDDFLDSSPLKPSLLTPPSDRTLALGKSKTKSSKLAKPVSEDVDPKDMDGFLDLIETPDMDMVSDH
jgi:hypothetical protein